MFQESLDGRNNDAQIDGGQVQTDEANANRRINYDALVEYAIENVDQFRASSLAFKNHGHSVLPTAIVEEKERLLIEFAARCCRQAVTTGIIPAKED